jgi:hypothetical protein
MFGPKSYNESQLIFKESREHVFEESLSAIEKGGFSNISNNKAEMKITADYRKFTVWGKIEITLIQSNDGTCVNIKSYAKKDNIYAIAQDPSEKILLAFKKQISLTSQSSENVNIPEQIKKLSDLKDSGILTVEEFESKKAELLSRM